jgi:hypothetical protein
VDCCGCVCVDCLNCDVCVWICVCVCVDCLNCGVCVCGLFELCCMCVCGLFELLLLLLLCVW